jgi:hypothetical protein
VTLAPPREIIPGACSCYPEGCYCSPENLGELMSQAGIAKLRADKAKELGDEAGAARHRAEQQRLRARIDAALKPQPAATPAGRQDAMTQQDTGGTRAETIAEIERLLVELSTRRDAPEDFNSKSDAYLAERLKSMKEWKERERATRVNAVRRSDAASIRATLRFDSAPNDDDWREARARVANSGVPPIERDAMVWRVATHLAWVRARDQLLGETVQARLDAAGDQAAEPSEMDRARAERDLQGSVPLGEAGRSDAFAALRHERRVEARARELAGARASAEAHEVARAAMPPPPPEPRLPLPSLRNAHLRELADAEERDARGGRKRL